uniref:Uncharacterized protein n=1 Tax=Anopheles atroparvus TaxID=41427 RepID=A0AAG5DMX1_ANOAO
MEKFKVKVLCRVFVALMVVSSVRANIKDEMRNGVSFKLTELIRRLFPVDEKIKQSVFDNIIPNIVKKIKDYIYTPSTTAQPTDQEPTTTEQSINEQSIISTESTTEP